MLRRKFIYDFSIYSALTNLMMVQSCRSSKKLNILVLGGTFFVGPGIVKAALAQGHKITLFNRGITNPTLFAQLPLIKGDREQGASPYEPLRKQKWDVVIDVWPENAFLIDEATTALQDYAHHYVFISSIAVYKNFQDVGLHENSDVVDLPEDRSQWYYSEEKLAAENLIRERFSNRHTILRAGPIKGWRDPAVDLLYWCLRLTQEDNIVAPGSGDDPLQFIDVDDVGRFAITAAQQKLNGTFNCTGPKQTMTWKNFLDLAKEHFDSNAELIWADESFLEEQGIYSFTDLPLWAPLSEDLGFMQISNKKLIETGFQLTPVMETLDRVMEWYQETGGEVIAFGSQEVGVGLQRSKELELIKWMNEKD